MAIPEKKKFFGYFIEQQNVWLECWTQLRRWELTSWAKNVEIEYGSLLLKAFPFLFEKINQYSSYKFVCLMCELQISFQDDWHRFVTCSFCMLFCLLPKIQQEIRKRKVSAEGSFADYRDCRFPDFLILFTLAEFFFPQVHNSPFLMLWISVKN